MPQPTSQQNGLREEAHEAGLSQKGLTIHPKILLPFRVPTLRRKDALSKEQWDDVKKKNFECLVSEKT